MIHFHPSKLLLFPKVNICKQEYGSSHLLTWFLKVHDLWPLFSCENKDCLLLSELQYSNVYGNKNWQWFMKKCTFLCNCLLPDKFVKKKKKINYWLLFTFYYYFKINLPWGKHGDLHIWPVLLKIVCLAADLLLQYFESLAWDKYADKVFYLFWYSWCSEMSWDYECTESSGSA